MGNYGRNGHSQHSKLQSVQHVFTKILFARWVQGLSRRQQSKELKSGLTLRFTIFSRMRNHLAWIEVVMFRHRWIFSLRDRFSKQKYFPELSDIFKQSKSELIYACVFSCSICSFSGADGISSYECGISPAQKELQLWKADLENGLPFYYCADCGAGLTWLSAHFIFNCHSWLTHSLSILPASFISQLMKDRHHLKVFYIQLCFVLRTCKISSLSQAGRSTR